MKKQWVVLVVVCLALMFQNSGCTAEKGRIQVSTDQEGAVIYVNGQKKAMTGASGEYTDMMLPEGDYEIKIEKETEDGN